MNRPNRLRPPAEIYSKQYYYNNLNARREELRNKHKNYGVPIFEKDFNIRRPTKANIENDVLHANNNKVHDSLANTKLFADLVRSRIIDRSGFIIKDFIVGRESYTFDDSNKLTEFTNTRANRNKRFYLILPMTDYGVAKYFARIPLEPLKLVNLTQIVSSMRASVEVFPFGQSQLDLIDYVTQMCQNPGQQQTSQKRMIPNIRHAPGGEVTHLINGFQANVNMTNPLITQLFYICDNQTNQNYTKATIVSKTFNISDNYFKLNSLLSECDKIHDSKRARVDAPTRNLINPFLENATIVAKNYVGDIIARNALRIRTRSRRAATAIQQPDRIAILTDKLSSICFSHIEKNVYYWSRSFLPINPQNIIVDSVIPPKKRAVITSNVCLGNYGNILSIGSIIDSGAEKTGETSNELMIRQLALCFKSDKYCKFIFSALKVIDGELWYVVINIICTNKLDGTCDMNFVKNYHSVAKPKINNEIWPLIIPNLMPPLLNPLNPLNPQLNNFQIDENMCFYNELLTEFKSEQDSHQYLLLLGGSKFGARRNLLTGVSTAPTGASTTRSGAAFSGQAAAVEQMIHYTRDQIDFARAHILFLSINSSPQQQPPHPNAMGTSPIMFSLVNAADSGKFIVVNAGQQKKIDLTLTVSTQTVQNNLGIPGNVVTNYKKTNAFGNYVGGGLGDDTFFETINNPKWDNWLEKYNGELNNIIVKADLTIILANEIKDLTTYFRVSLIIFKILTKGEGEGDGAIEDINDDNANLIEQIINKLDKNYNPLKMQSILAEFEQIGGDYDEMVRDEFDNNAYNPIQDDAPSYTDIVVVNPDKMQNLSLNFSNNGYSTPVVTPYSNESEFSSLNMTHNDTDNANNVNNVNNVNNANNKPNLWNRVTQKVNKHFNNYGFTNFNSRKVAPARVAGGNHRRRRQTRSKRTQYKKTQYKKRMSSKLKINV